ncbi:MAG: hypothetical protein LBI86_09675 [Treponema sp.]|nr:hypothetical protein [Treponema sp.]
MEEEVYSGLPAGPDPEGTAVPFLAAADVKAAISAKLYDELTCGDDEITARSVEAAVIMEQSLLDVVKRKLCAALPLHREIGRLLSVYELYVYNGDEKGGREYLTAATDLISINYGDVGAAKTAVHAAGAVKKPDRGRRP